MYTQSVAARKQRREAPRLNEIAALMLVVVTLLIALVRLINDDSLQMARRVTEMTRNEPTSQLSRSVTLQD